jgi:hypothetical protein
MQKPAVVPVSDRYPWTLVTVVAAALIAFPLLDLFVMTWPPRVSELSWRVGVLGVLSGALLLPAAGLLLLASIFAIRHRRAPLLGASIVAVTAGLALLALGLGFGLDGIQIRASLAEAARPGFERALLKAEVVFVLMAGGLLWAGVRGVLEYRRLGAPPAHFIPPEAPRERSRSVSATH